MDLYDGLLDGSSADLGGGWSSGATKGTKRAAEDEAPSSSATTAAASSAAPAKPLGAGFMAFKPRVKNSLTSSSNSSSSSGSGLGSTAKASIKSALPVTGVQAPAPIPPPPLHPRPPGRSAAAQAEVAYFDEDGADEAVDPSDFYVPSRPNDYLQHCKERLDAIRLARVERQNRSILQAREDERERDLKAGVGGVRGLARGARGINQMPAWMQQQQQRGEPQE